MTRQYLYKRVVAVIEEDCIIFSMMSDFDYGCHNLPKILTRFSHPEARSNSTSVLSSFGFKSEITQYAIPPLLKEKRL